MSHQRGIIIAPPFVLSPDDGPVVLGHPSLADIRKYLLYWDEIDYPENDSIRITLDPDFGRDFQFLIDAAVATRTQVVFRRPITAKFKEYFVLTQQMAFEKHEAENPGSWSLAQLSTTPYFLDSHTRRSIEYELWNMLPVPQDHVSINDILEFKQKRRDELSALRMHLDEMYQSIISSADLPRAKNSQLIKLEMDLNTIDRTLSEFGIQKAITSLRGFIAGEFPNMAGVGLGAVGVAPLIEMSPLIAGLAGAGVTFAIRTVLSPKAPKHVHPLTYVSSVKKDL